MSLKRSRSRDEICYPFIYEHSYLCDFEVATDELCGHIGAILAVLSPEFEDIAADLESVQPLIYHLNGSIRGRLAVDEENQAWLLERYHAYQALTKDKVNGFVLPRGPMPVPQLNLARSAAKKAIRIMVRLDEEGVEVPDILHHFCNLLCNFFFVLTLVINQRLGFEETPFISRSYGSTP